MKIGVHTLSLSLVRFTFHWILWARSHFCLCKLQLLKRIESRFKRAWECRECRSRQIWPTVYIYIDIQETEIIWVFLIYLGPWYPYINSFHTDMDLSAFILHPLLITCILTTNLFPLKLETYQIFMEPFKHLKTKRRGRGVTGLSQVWGDTRLPMGR